MARVGRRKPAQRYRRREHIHVEAYPALDVRSARRQVLADHNHVLWLDGRGRVRGQGFAVLDGAELDFAWHLRSFRKEDDVTHRKTFELMITHGDMGQTDCFTKCPSCLAKVRIVILVDVIWACSDCQGLTWRSNLIGQVGRKSEKLIKLEEKLSGGRPKACTAPPTAT